LVTHDAPESGIDWVPCVVCFHGGRICGVHRLEQTAQLGMDEVNRLRWQCRRGLLELDLVLERFLELHLADLNAERLHAFRTLLGFADDALWDLIRERTGCRDPLLAEAVRWLRECRSSARR